MNESIINFKTTIKMDKKVKMEKLKSLLELISDVDIMYHEEYKEYFFEWMKDGNIITVWLGEYCE